MSGDNIDVYGMLLRTTNARTLGFLVTSWLAAACGPVGVAAAGPPVVAVREFIRLIWEVFRESLGSRAHGGTARCRV